MHWCLTGGFAYPLASLLASKAWRSRHPCLLNVNHHNTSTPAKDLEARTFVTKCMHNTALNMHITVQWVYFWEETFMWIHFCGDSQNQPGMTFFLTLCHPRTSHVNLNCSHVWKHLMVFFPNFELNVLFYQSQLVLYWLQHLFQPSRLLIRMKQVVDCMCRGNESWPPSMGHMTTSLQGRCR